MSCMKYNIIDECWDFLDDLVRFGSDYIVGVIKETEAVLKKKKIRRRKQKIHSQHPIRSL